MPPKSILHPRLRKRSGAQLPKVPFRWNHLHQQSARPQSPPESRVIRRTEHIDNGIQSALRKGQTPDVPPKKRKGPAIVSARRPNPSSAQIQASPMRPHKIPLKRLRKGTLATAGIQPKRRPGLPQEGGNLIRQRPKKSSRQKRRAPLK
jgi:hypothetical protein